MKNDFIKTKAKIITPEFWHQNHDNVFRSNSS